MSSWDVIAVTAAGGSSVPSLLVTVVILLKPQAEKPTTSRVRITSASSNLRREAS